jgi:hypothetical protein
VAAMSERRCDDLRMGGFPALRKRSRSFKALYGQPPAGRVAARGYLTARSVSPAPAPWGCAPSYRCEFVWFVRILYDFCLKFTYFYVYLTITISARPLRAGLRKLSTGTLLRDRVERTQGGESPPRYDFQER